jgi:hypothetical protein
LHGAWVPVAANSPRTAISWVYSGAGSDQADHPDPGAAGLNPGTIASAAVIDSLKTLVNNLKPGLGECMLQLKYHHDRLGEAIAVKDYERAGYEVDEMKEMTEKIIQLNITNDKLQKPFALFYEKYLQSPLAVLSDVAPKKDGPALRTNFITLTSNCNSCHQENNMRFMKITP